jgi:glutaconate CoA-transferase subunit B
MLTPQAASQELELTALFADATVEEARAAVGWPLRVGAQVETLAPPTSLEIETLRALHARTREAHRRPVHVPA